MVAGDLDIPDEPQDCSDNLQNLILQYIESFDLRVGRKTLAGLNKERVCFCFNIKEATDQS